MHNKIRKAFHAFEKADTHLNEMLKLHGGRFNYEDSLYALVVKMEKNSSQFDPKEIEFLEGARRMLQRAGAGRIENSMLEPQKFWAQRMVAKYEIS